MNGRTPAIGMDEEVAFLRRPEAWPSRPERVEVVETHLSFVFLVGDEAYKLKKAIRFVHDLRSAEARRQSCETEVRLNERLAPGVYLGTVPLAVARDGSLGVGRTGTPVDWMVRMRRLPDDRFLDHQIRTGTVDPVRLRAAATRLARFHLSLPPRARDARAYARELERQIREAGVRLVATDGPAVVAVERALLAWLEARHGLLAGRVAAGRIVEGHGDLRPEHVSLVDPPVVLDCLDFDVRLRTLDALDELGYLALECERLGAIEVGQVFLDTWRAIADDDPPADLLPFHQAMRAFTRASIAALRLEAGPDATDKLRERVASYLHAAEGRLLLMRGHA